MTKENNYPENLFPFLVKHYYNHTWLGIEREDGVIGNAHFIKENKGEFYYNDPHTEPDEPIKKGKELSDVALRIIAVKRKQLQEMIDRDIVTPKARAIHTPTVKSFYDKLKVYNGEDGAVAFILDELKMLSVGQLDHLSKISKRKYQEYRVLPKDYWPPTEKNLFITTTSTGKSMLYKTSGIFGDSYGISATALTPIGTGLIIHFREGTLFETYLLDTITDYKKGHAEAIGTYRRYQDENKKSIRKRGCIIPTLEIKTDHNLLTPEGKSVYN